VSLIFSCFSCGSWLRCIFWLRLYRAGFFVVKNGFLCAFVWLKFRRSRLISLRLNYLSVLDFIKSGGFRKLRDDCESDLRIPLFPLLQSGQSGQSFAGRLQCFDPRPKRTALQPVTLNTSPVTSHYSRSCHFGHSAHPLRGSPSKRSAIRRL